MSYPKPETPLPWHSHDFTDADGEYTDHEVWSDANDAPHVYNGSQVADVDRNADRDYIIVACNAFPKFIAACEQVVRASEECRCGCMPCACEHLRHEADSEALWLAREALKLARGEA